MSNAQNDLLPLAPCRRLPVTATPAQIRFNHKARMHARKVKRSVLTSDYPTHRFRGVHTTIGVFGPSKNDDPVYRKQVTAPTAEAIAAKVKRATSRKSKKEAA